MLTPPEYHEQYTSTRKRESKSVRMYPGSYDLLKELTATYGFENDGQTLEYILVNAKNTPVQAAVNPAEIKPEFNLKSPADYEAQIAELQAANDEYEKRNQEMQDTFTNAFGGIDMRDPEALMDKLMQMVAPGLQQIQGEMDQALQGVMTGEEKDLTERFKKILYVINSQKQDIAALKTQLENANTVPGETELQDNQALLTFTDEQLTQLRQLRKIITRIHPEIDDDPTQVIFAGIAAALEYLKDLERLVNTYSKFLKQPV